MKPKKPLSDDVKREIEVRAYLIWESEGRPHGRAHEHWQRAEAEVLGTASEPKPEKKAARVKSNSKAAAPAKAVVAAKAKKSAKAAKTGPHHG